MQVGGLSKSYRVGGGSPKVWLAKLVIGLAGGDNAIPRLGLQAYREWAYKGVYGRM